jgi:DNA-binding NarL/FixJ family response regulator
MTLSESTSDRGPSVLIVEPVEVVRAGLRGLLERAPDMTVVGEATTGEEAVQQTEELSPAVALVGLDPSEPGSVESIRRIANGLRRTGVIVVREGASAEALVVALRAGAQGYLSREVGGEFLLEAVRVVSRGGAVVDPGAAHHLVACLTSTPGLRSVGGRLRPAPPFHALSERESQVLRSLVEGLSNKEIALDLGLRVGTVKTHVHHIFRKLGVSDRTSAALAAVRSAELPASF